MNNTIETHKNSHLKNIILSLVIIFVTSTTFIAISYFRQEIAKNNASAQSLESQLISMQKKLNRITIHLAYIQSPNFIQKYVKNSMNFPSNKQIVDMRMEERVHNLPRGITLAQNTLEYDLVSRNL